MANTDSIPARVEILFSLDGKTIRGGATERRDPVTGRLSGAIPIGKDKDFPWSLITEEINAAALASNAELTEQLSTAQSALAALQTKTSAALAQAKAVIADPQVDDATTIQTISGLVVGLERRETDRKRDALGAQIAALQAEKDALPA